VDKTAVRSGHLLGFNAYAAAAYDLKAGTLFLHRFSPASTVAVPIGDDLPAVPASLVPIGDGLVVFRVEKEIFRFSAAASSVEPVELDFAEATLLRADPTDEFRFLCLGDGGYIWAAEFDGDEFQYKELMPLPDVTDFVVSSEYLVAVVKETEVRCFTRDEFGQEPIFLRAIRPVIQVYCDDVFYYERTGRDHFVRFAIENFSGNGEGEVIRQNQIIDDGSALILGGESRTDFYIQDLHFHSDQPFVEMTAFDTFVAVWNAFDAPPEIRRLNKTKPVITEAELIEMQQTAIASVDGLTRAVEERYVAVLGTVDQFSADLTNRLALLQNQTARAASALTEFESLLIERRLVSLSLCLRELQLGEFEKGFRLALELTAPDFLAFCGTNRLLTAIEDRTVSDQTLIEIVQKLVALLEEFADTVCPMLLAALLYFDPDDRLAQHAIQPLTSELLTVTLALFQTVTPTSPIFADLRRLSHVAVSFQRC
jgi:hypothetical protein